MALLSPNPRDRLDELFPFEGKANAGKCDRLRLCAVMPKPLHKRFTNCDTSEIFLS